MRIQFARIATGSFCRMLKVGACCAVAAIVCASASAAPPTPSISTLGTSGPAPFTVHVNGLGSNPGAGDQLTTRYEWTFGDASGQFNTLNGWVAAHIYNNPGTYTVTLKVTNRDGQSATTTRQITVTADNRNPIYVSPDGNDSNSGTQSAPVKTFAKAATMVTSNRAIYFRRNATYSTNSTMNITQQNVLIGAYGSGSMPVIYYTSGALYADIFNLTSTASDVVIQDIKIDSSNAVNNDICRAIRARGSRITVRNCQFGNVSYAMNCGGGGAYGMFTLNNLAGNIGAYYVWGEGADHTHVGNTVQGSTNEHNIRMGGTNRFLIAHNDLTNVNKSTIWCMLGDHAYIGNNILREGRVLVGPNYALGSPSERFFWTVIENNHIINEGMIFYSGAENIMVRNNIIKYDGGEGLSIWGWYAPMSRTVRNLTAANNTGINNSASWGRFAKIGSGADTLKFYNNLYIAPWLNSQNGSANVRTDDGNLNSHTFQNNIWSNPATGSAHHFLANVGYNSSQWNNFSQTSNETHRTASTNDLNANFVPQFSAGNAPAVVGVFTDFHGNLRPASNWTKGAVEINIGNQNPPGNKADVNNDGIVNVDDLIVVLSNWGACQGASCPADLNHDAAVNVDDLSVLLAAWTQ